MTKGARDSLATSPLKKGTSAQGELALDLSPVASAEHNTHFEEHYTKKGFKAIAGVDEAGRGPLAGPVVAASVILPNGFYHDSIKDSKKLNEKKRDEIYKIIIDSARAVGVGIVSEREIEEMNILNAALTAMDIALSELALTPDFVLVDGNRKVGTTIPQKTIVKGDSKSISIAAASIVAKVTRDRIMCQHHRTYPSYNFKGHKGYGTKEHLEAIRKHGITKIHRRTFAPIKEMLDEG